MHAVRCRTGSAVNACTDAGNGQQCAYIAYYIHYVRLFQGAGVLFEVLNAGSARTPGSTSIGAFELWSACGA